MYDIIYLAIILIIRRLLCIYFSRIIHKVVFAQNSQIVIDDG